MSYQLVCDNCGASVPALRQDARLSALPTNWEPVYGSSKGEHHCAECVSAKTQARWDAQGKLRNAEEAALAARREGVKP